MYVDGNRMMSWIATIDEVRPIENADAICSYRVGGWWVVDRKDAYAVGDRCIYVSIDSWVPNTIAPFLSKGKEPREYQGVRGERLRTIRLRGTLSQGLVLPISVLPRSLGFEYAEEASMGEEVSHWLGIAKWEPVIPACLAGMAKGNFPSRVPKTDAERVQNLSRKLQDWIAEETQFEVSVKLDGSSMTVAAIDDEVHVCSRNLSLKLDQQGNSFVDVAKSTGLTESIRTLGKNIAIQGELCGPGIQKNQEKLQQFEFFVFEIYDVDAAHYLSPAERRTVCEKLSLRHVPVLHDSITLKQLNINSVDAALAYADGPSLNSSVPREGLVFKNADGSIKWKAISNSWLLKND